MLSISDTIANVELIPWRIKYGIRYPNSFHVHRLFIRDILHDQTYILEQQSISFPTSYMLDLATPTLNGAMIKLEGLRDYQTA